MIHGGKSLLGAASPTYKSGRYSKVMPTHLAAIYEQVQTDPDLLGIQEDIRLQDTLLQTALDGMSRGEAGELWVQLNASWQEYQKAQRNPKKYDETQALYMVGFLIKEGYQDYMARIELRQMLQERARLVDAEVKRLERAQASVNAVQLTHIILRMAEAVAKYVDDERAVQAITGEFYALVGASA